MALVYYLYYQAGIGMLWLVFFLNMSVSSEECVPQSTIVSIFLTSNEPAGICVTQALIGTVDYLCVPWRANKRAGTVVDGPWLVNNLCGGTWRACFKRRRIHLLSLSNERAGIGVDRPWLVNNLCGGTWRACSPRWRSTCSWTCWPTARTTYRRPQTGRPKSLLPLSFCSCKDAKRGIWML